MDQQIRAAAALIKASHNTVVVTGAGISTEAGIPDFRGANGIYRKIGEDKAMSVINIGFFNRDPATFYDFYREYFSFPDIKPAKAHYILAEMEKQGRIKAIVTQNVDNLHQLAGSRRVIAVHGSGGQFECQERLCREVVPAEQVDLFNGDPVPLCPVCGGVLKPDVVLFGESIKDYGPALDTILKAKLIIVIGSSLTVHPLAGFVASFNSFTQDLMIINKGRTALDHAAQLKIDVDNTGELLEKINAAIDRM
ncbi:MAG: Sir2 family NAD-dependent protein deacetylase [Syntrophomonadaceae bacterium]|nr:Sir2 family NAD-dependent protein deacetylase [Syntrophomonadaceae bacterium]